MDSIVDTSIQDEVIRILFNDVQHFQGIIEDVNRSVRYETASITKQEIANALNQLVAAGLAEAYVLPQNGPFTKVDFDPARLNELWFQATPKGETLARELIQRTQ